MDSIRDGLLQVNDLDDFGTLDELAELLVPKNATIVSSASFKAPVEQVWSRRPHARTVPGHVRVRVLKCVRVCLLCAGVPAKRQVCMFACLYVCA